MIAELAALALAALPAVMTIVNLRALGTPAPMGGRPAVSVLIPARDEELNIEACVASVLASRGIDLEIIVLDDGSTDRTADILRRLAQREPRLSCETSPPLPRGWNGKQHACHVLSLRATNPTLVFVDADVRFEPDGLACLMQALERADLVSGVPRQIVGSVAEKLLIPMINTLILGYLPVPLMRRRPDVGLGAACGQLIAVRRSAYRQAGGHAAIRASLHDGLHLPRLFRSSGLRTDLVDGTRLARCRMYADAGSVMRGLLKNATDGMARPVALPIWTTLLIGGHVLPWLLLVSALLRHDGPSAAIAAIACALTVTARALQARRCGEPPSSVALHPFGVASLVALQWLALLRRAQSRPTTWRGRTYDAHDRGST